MKETVSGCFFLNTVYIRYRGHKFVTDIFSCICVDCEQQPGGGEWKLVGLGGCCSKMAQPF